MSGVAASTAEGNISDPALGTPLEIGYPQPEGRGLRRLNPGHVCDSHMNSGALLDSRGEEFVGAQASPPVRRRQLGQRLRQLRTHARMSLEEAAKHLELSVSKLSRIEPAKQMVDVHGVRAMLDLYGLTCDQWEPIVDLAREARQKGWWRAYGIPDRGYVELETAASSVRDFQLAHVPGLLQTADYARALFRVSQLRRTEDQIEMLIAARMVRQQRLTDDDPLGLSAIVDEAVLRRPVGSTEIMCAQLRHMVECAELPHVTLQALPISAGAHLGMDGAFLILSFSEAAEPDAVYIEHPPGAPHFQDGADVNGCTLRFDRLRSEALSLAESVALIQRVAREL